MATALSALTPGPAMFMVPPSALITGYHRIRCLALQWLAAEPNSASTTGSAGALQSVPGRCRRASAKRHHGSHRDGEWHACEFRRQCFLRAPRKRLPHCYPIDGITPCAAGQFTSYDLPAYAEQASASGNLFALNYAPKNVIASRSELGSPAPLKASSPIRSRVRLARGC